MQKHSGGVYIVGYYFHVFFDGETKFNGGGKLQTVYLIAGGEKGLCHPKTNALQQFFFGTQVAV